MNVQSNKIALTRETHSHTSQKIANVFIIGAAKSGTSHLCALLNRHSQICVNKSKEPCFFAYDSEYQKGLEYYSDGFSEATDEHKVLIDGSTPYSRCTVFPNVPERIFKAVPDAKFVYVMRHPIDRAFSHYTHRWMKEVHPGESFSETFEEYVEHDRMCIDDSLYKLQVEQYLEYFPIDRFLFLLTEDLNPNWEETLKKICDHIGIDYEPIENEQSNKSNVASDFRSVQARNTITSKLKAIPGVSLLASIMPRSFRQWIYSQGLRKLNLYKKELSRFTPKPMRPETRQRLANHFEESITWVEQTLNKDLSAWRK